MDGITDSKQKRLKCEYCRGRRVTDPDFGKKEIDFGKLAFHMSGFTSGKLRLDDFEHLLNMGYTRSGNYFYHRD